MKITAKVHNSLGQHHVTLTTNDQSHSIDISPKPSGLGSVANGGEVLLLAIATCYCNDIYREAAKRGIEVQSVEVIAEAKFGAEGEPASGVAYHAKVKANAPEADILDLMQHTDTVAEIQNTLRTGTSVTLRTVEVESV